MVNVDESAPDEGRAASVAEQLRRWEQFGGAWKVLAQDGSQLTISMCRCDGGEEVERVTAGGRELEAFLGGRTSSEQ